MVNPFSRFLEVYMSEIDAIPKGSCRSPTIVSGGNRGDGLRVATEPFLAAADRKPISLGAVVIDSNENPLGPCKAARKAIAEITPQGGRYSFWFTDELVESFAAVHGLKPEYIRRKWKHSDPLSGPS
jgi:hypothetical protein